MTATQRSVLPLYQVSRRVLLQEDLNDISGFEEKNEKFLDPLLRVVRQFRCTSVFFSLIPVLKWLPKYAIKKKLFGDLSAGLTVAIMQIPQGMGFALLAGVPPSVGLYMAFFHCLTYFVFGTSRHISVGTSSVVSVMTLQFVNEYATSHTMGSGVTIQALYTPNQVVTALSMCCGIQLVLMSIFQLGIVAALLSESLISGFMTGAAVHVLVSQLKDIVGIKIGRITGVLKIGKIMIALGTHIKDTNITALSISLIVIILLVIINDVLKPRLSKLCRFPVPAEILVVASGTLASALMQLGTKHNVHLVGHIPLGLPHPELPPLELLGKVAFGAIPIAIVSYTVSISMAVMMSIKRKYDVRPNQELFALGACNLVGGMFSCVPIGTSLVRTIVQEHIGGNTQVASVVSACLILLVVLWIGGLFEALPRCVLAGIIVVALRGMFMKVCEVKRFHRESKFNSFTWVVTFVVVVLVDVDIGLYVGILTSLVTIYFKGYRSSLHELGNIPDTDLYVDLSTHRRAQSIPKVRIFRHIGPINFAFGNSFKTALYNRLDVTHKTIRHSLALTEIESVTGNASAKVPQNVFAMRTLVVDLSCVALMDVSGVKMLQEISKQMELVGVQLILAGPNDPVDAVFKRAATLGVVNFVMVPTVHDAVLLAKSQM